MSQEELELARLTVQDRYLNGWRPSTHTPGMWDKAVWDLPPDTPAPEWGKDEVPDPEQEPMTDAEKQILGV